jgi:DNA-binding beta-propeller fold protein YncE
MLLATSFDSNELRVFNTTTGEIALALGKAGSGAGEFNGPWGVVVTPDSKHVIVSECGTRRLQVFATTFGDDGSTISLKFSHFIMSNLRSPQGLSIKHKSGNIVVVDTSRHAILEFLLDGTLVKTYSNNGKLKNPYDATVLQSGQVAVADLSNHRICMFDAAGNYQFSFGAQGAAADGHFYHPCALASDEGGNILVLDWTPRLQVFTAGGKHLCTRKDFSMQDNGLKAIAWRSGNGIAIASGWGCPGASIWHASTSLDD